MSYEKSSRYKKDVQTMLVTDLTPTFTTVEFSAAEYMGGQLWLRWETGKMERQQAGAEDT